LALAGVAAAAAKHDVLPGDDFCIVDDVLPTRCAATGHLRRCKFDAAVDAGSISFSNFSLQPSRDIPVIGHGDSELVYT